VATLDDEVAGMVIVLSDSSGYQISTGGLQIATPKFLYIDRVVVGAWARGRGVAKG
jgi:predicted GNAT superfamily acetyltransferase